MRLQVSANMEVNGTVINSFGRRVTIRTKLITAALIRIDFKKKKKIRVGTKFKIGDTTFIKIN